MTKAALQNESVFMRSWRAFVLKYYQLLQETAEDCVSFVAL